MRIDGTLCWPTNLGTLFSDLAVDERKMSGKIDWNVFDTNQASRGGKMG